MAFDSLHPDYRTASPQFAGLPLKGPGDYLGLIRLADRLAAAGFYEFAAAALDDAAAAMEGHPKLLDVRGWAGDFRAEARRRAVIAGSIVVSGVRG